ncbi:MAG: hypothetical protein KDB07_05800, partial [Planctomycetes bacterium]|nr:hypothetical protein [Planctomycetota bacterium]
MSRHKKPIPPEFRLAVREGLGYHRLKKRFGVGGSTISRWLDECGLRTHNAPSPGLGSFNQSQALSRRYKIKEHVQKAIDQENTRRWASLVAKMEQPKMNTGQPETRTGQPV